MRRRCRRSPPARSASKSVAQNGAVATRSAAMPLGTHCSAQTTLRLPMPTRSAPTTAISRRTRRSRGRRSPRSVAMAKRITPAPR